MNIGWVKEKLDKGVKVSRKGWNGKGMYIFLFSKSNFCTKETNTCSSNGNLIGYNFELDDENENPMWHMGFLGEDNNNNKEEFYPLKDFVLLKTAGNYCIPWNASQEDLQATDWELSILNK